MSDVVLLPDSDPAIPVTASVAKSSSKPASSAIIQVPRTRSGTTEPPLSSTKIKSQDPPSTTTIKIPKSTTSVTIPTVKEGAPSGKPTSKSRGTDGGMSTRRSSSSTQIPTFDPDAVEPAPGTPVLKRLSSYEVPIASLDESELSSSYGGPSKRRRSKEEEADIQWIKTLIIRAAVAGGIALVVLIVIGELWRALSPKATGTPVAPSVQFALPSTDVRQT